MQWLKYWIWKWTEKFIFLFQALSQNFEKRKQSSSCLFILFSARKNSGSHWTDFHKILHLSIYLKSVAKTKVSLKSDEHNEYFTWKPAYVNSNLLNSSYYEKLFNTRHRENENINFVFNTFFRNSYSLWDNLETKLGTTIQDTHGNITQRTRFAFWITRATDTYII